MRSTDSPRRKSPKPRAAPWRGRRRGKALSGADHPPAGDDLAAGLEQTLAALIGDHEAQRERVGRILHDDIGQVLSGVGLQIAALRMDFQDIPGIVERTTALQEMLERAMTEVRDLSTELSPSEVERSGLNFALERLLDRHRMLFTGGMRLQFDPAARLPREIAKTFYRVAEHAIGRAARRVEASQVEVQVKIDGAGVAMEIRHDGLTPHAREDSNPVDRIEILILEQHARRAGISLRIESAPGRGTIVSTGYAELAEGRKND